MICIGLTMQFLIYSYLRIIMRLFFLFSFVLICHWIDGQVGQNDSLIYKKRLLIASTTSGLVYSSSLIALHNVWYKDYPKSNFHFFNDSRNWLQMDKCGHAFSAYVLSQKTGEVFRWSGAKKSYPWIGFSIGMSYLTALELMDAYNSEWGFSGYDVVANFSGGALYLTQELVFKKQLVIPKFSFSPSPYAKVRPEILGSNFSEQLLKDYNGQTYWLSLPIGAWSSKVKKMNWLCLSFGYSVDQKLVGDENLYLDFKASRQFLFSLDVDLTRLPIKNPTLKKVLSHLNMIKIPFPALLFQQGKVYAKPIYF